MLLAHPDIDINRQNNVSETALDWANNQDIKELLLSGGAKKYEDLNK